MLFRNPVGNGRDNEPDDVLLWGSGMPQVSMPETPFRGRTPVPVLKPTPPIPVLKPELDEDDDGWVSRLARGLWDSLDDFFGDPSKGPVETPPLDPPSTPPPPVGPFPGHRRRFPGPGRFR